VICLAVVCRPVAGRKDDFARLCAFFEDGRDQNAVTQHEFILDLGIPLRRKCIFE
jgi:hypothetical protein